MCQNVYSAAKPHYFYEALAHFDSAPTLLKATPNSLTKQNLNKASFLYGYIFLM
jgi:hypothetical protein